MQTLVLDDNAISDWRALRPLYSLISLRCLSLSDNSIECIPSEELSGGMHPHSVDLFLSVMPRQASWQL